MFSSHRLKTRGAINLQLVAIFGLLALVVGLSGLSAWLFVQYRDQKVNVDNKIGLAEAEARRKQSEEDEVLVKQAEEKPPLEFSGPEDYGSFSFKYPNNWSVYVASNASSGSGKYTAYLHPIIIQPINSRDARFALIVNIDSTPYDKVLDTYKSSIQKGEITSKPISVNGHDGTRFDGSFSKDVRGAAAVFKVRDKTVTLTTQADTFKEYFNTLLETVDFND